MDLFAIIKVPIYLGQGFYIVVLIGSFGEELQYVLYILSDKNFIFMNFTRFYIADFLTTLSTDYTFIQTL